MRKISMLLPFLTMLCLNAFSQSPDVTRLVGNIEKSIFTVFSIDNNGQVFSQGSGFFIESSGIGITNYHVLDGAYKAQIRLSDGTIVPIESVCDYNQNADLVKFKVAESNVPYKALPLTNVIPMRGTPILSLSSPLGLEQTASTGIVSAVRDDNIYGKIIQITAPISHGSSGSPIVNMKGEVLGISTFGITEGQSLNFAVSTLAVRELTKDRHSSLYSIWNDPLETILVKQARELRSKGNLDDAISLLKKEVEENPKNHLAYSELGFTLVEKGEDGFDFLYKACLLDSLNANYWNGLAIQVSRDNDRAHGNLEYFQLSFDDYMRAIYLDSQCPQYYSNLALLLYKSCYHYRILEDKYLDIAVQVINNAIELNPNAKNYTLRARMYVAKKDIGKALLDCDNAILMDPEYSQPYFVRGDAKAFELLDFYGGLIDVEKALALVDYNYTNPNTLKYYKCDFLGIKAEIYGRLMIKELDPNYYSKIETCLNEAYELNPLPTYKKMKEDFYDIYIKLTK